MKDTGVSNEELLQVLLSMDERVATKDDLEQAVEHLRAEMLDIVEPAKAVDKDAETLIKHEKRIDTLERSIGLATK